LALYSELRWRVAQKLALQWSPQQKIYRSLFIQTRGVLKKELTAQLRTARRMRPQREEWTGAYPRYGLHPRAARRD
jgi:hypothetical protein